MVWGFPFPRCAQASQASLLELHSYFLFCFPGLCWDGCCSWTGGYKDAKHLVAVEKVGGDFIPLVVEYLGIWTPLDQLLDPLLIIPLPIAMFHSIETYAKTFSVFMDKQCQDDFTILGSTRFGLLFKEFR